jgi:hypothetical protein
MAEKISSRTSLGMQQTHEIRELRILLNAAQTDLAALRAAIIGVNAKLDADAGVTDVNYGSLWNPAALTFIK